MGGSSSRATKSSASTHVSSPYRAQLEDIYEDLCLNGSLQKDKFLEHFSGPSNFIGEILFKEMTEEVLRDSESEKLPASHHHRDCLMNKEGFVTRATRVIEKAYKSKRAQLFYYYKLVAHNKEELHLEDLTELFAFCCMFGFLVANYDTKHMKNLKEDKILAAHAKSIVGENGTVSKQEFLAWIEEHNPNIFAAFQSWIHAKLTSSIPKSHFHMIRYTNPDETDSSMPLLSASLLWHLCCVLPSCYTEPDKRIEAHQDDEDHEDFNDYRWSLLYDSNQHGLSLNRFKHKCMDYKSPNVSLILLRSGRIIALALDRGWQDSSEKFGGPYSAMYEIVPDPTVVLATSGIFYLKSVGRNVHTGLQIGNAEPAKLRLDKDFSTAEVLYKGAQLDDVSSIEVWGCGGLRATQSQRKQKEWEKKELEKRAKVKRPGRWDENPDRAILEMGGVTVHHSERSET